MCLSTQEKQHGICHLPFGTLPTDPAVTAQIHRRTAGLIRVKPAGYSPHPEEGPKLAMPICVYLHRCGIVFDLIIKISNVMCVFNQYQTIKPSVLNFRILNEQGSPRVSFASAPSQFVGAHVEATIYVNNVKCIHSDQISMFLLTLTRISPIF